MSVVSHRTGAGKVSSAAKETTHSWSSFLTVLTPLVPVNFSLIIKWASPFVQAEVVVSSSNPASPRKASS